VARTKGGSQGAIAPQPLGVGEAFGSYQYGYQERRECVGGIDLMGGSPAHRHPLRDLADQIDLAEVAEENGDPAEGGHRSLGLTQNQALAGKQSVDFPRN